nr:MAG TPA: hypothetical protein [Microviridae sp.]
MQTECNKNTGPTVTVRRIFVSLGGNVIKRDISPQCDPGR